MKTAESSPVVNKACELGAMAEVIELSDFIKYRDSMLSLLDEKDAELQDLKNEYVENYNNIVDELKVKESELEEMTKSRDLGKECNTSLSKELEAVKLENERLKGKSLVDMYMKCCDERDELKSQAEKLEKENNDLRLTFSKRINRK